MSILQGKAAVGSGRPSSDSNAASTTDRCRGSMKNGCRQAFGLWLSELWGLLVHCSLRVAELTNVGHQALDFPIFESLAPGRHILAQPDRLAAAFDGIEQPLVGLLRHPRAIGKVARLGGQRRTRGS